MSMYRVTALLIFLSFFSCQEETTPPAEEDQTKVVEVLPDLFFGIDRNQFTVQTQKIKRGDTFGKILEDNGIDYPEVYSILQAIKGKVNVRARQDKWNFRHSFSLLQHLIPARQGAIMINGRPLIK